MKSKNTNQSKFNLSIRLIFLAVATIVFAATIFAAGNHLDYGFDGDGKTTFSFSTSSGDEARAVAIQPDGKIVVAGVTLSSTPRDFAVARLNADGTFDATFDTDGRATADFGGNIDTAFAVILQADGKIVVVGETAPSNGTFDFAVARFNSDGSLDNSFDGDGKATFDFSGGNDAAFAVAVQTDGKIVVAGEAPISGNNNWGLVRLNANGSPDTTFDGDGKANTDFAGGGDYAKGLAILPDGKIIVGGTAVTSSDANFALARYNSNGSLDTSFDGDGKMMTDFNAGSSEGASGFERTAGGKLVLTGFYQPASGGALRVAVARYNADGTLDATFDGDGKVVTDLNPNDNEFGNNLAVQPNGDIVVACQTNAFVEGGGFTALRYLNNGALDDRFGAGGRVNTIFSADASTAFDVAIQTDGKIVAVGGAKNNSDFAVARYKANGIAAPADFDGAGQADFAVYRASNNTWYVLDSATNVFNSFQFGVAGDVPAPGDYDGDAITDAAIYRPSTGTWWIRRSSNPNNFQAIQFGIAEDKPAQGDYDGDGKTDLAVFRPSSATWYLQRSTLGLEIIPFGASTDKLVPADFDGDGLTDVAIFRPSDGNWWIRQTAFGALKVTKFGVSSDRPVASDFDGDGRADIAVFRPSEANWYINQSRSFSIRILNWGTTGDVPAPADYDSDGKTDVSVFRPSNGSWWILQSADETLRGTILGASGDVPVSTAYASQ